VLGAYCRGHQRKPRILLRRIGLRPIAASYNTWRGGWPGRGGRPRRRAMSTGSLPQGMDSRRGGNPPRHQRVRTLVNLVEIPISVDTQRAAVASAAFDAGARILMTSAAWVQMRAWHPWRAVRKPDPHGARGRSEHGRANRRRCGPALRAGLRRRGRPASRPRASCSTRVSASFVTAPCPGWRSTAPCCATWRGYAPWPAVVGWGVRKSFIGTLTGRNVRGAARRIAGRCGGGGAGRRRVIRTHDVAHAGRRAGRAGGPRGPSPVTAARLR